VIALALGGLVVSRVRVVRELNSRAFMPVVYSAVTVYWAIRAHRALGGHGRAWPYLLLAVLFFAGVIQSVRASGVLKNPGR
jgi:hypothetical protein